ncbi:hypothetical protein Tco_0728368 [Tanacetum coccineum]|uniref:Uncharacterized protein n=1 Tax=Tanacetum coccineum TaxID=301880 RepID=A0ABQ4YNK2_9ASTR
MSSITAQQIKLDLELVPKEKRLDIGKCNRRLNPGKIQREPTFQVVLYALALTPCYSVFLITTDVLEVYMHQFWDSVYKHDTFYRFKWTKGRDSNLIWKSSEISLRSALEYKMHQPWRTFAALINRSLSGKTTGLDKLLSTEEPTGKSKRVKRPKKKSTKAPARGVVIRETFEMPLSKKKEKVDVTRGKGIELLSEVALAKDAQFEEVKRKSIRDFHKTHPSGSGTITKTAPSATKIKPSVTNKGTGVKPGVPDVTEEVSSEKENEEDDVDEEEVKDEIVKTPSNDSDDEDETLITDKAAGDEDEEMDYTTSQLYDDVDIRLNEPIDTDKGFV